MKKITLLLLSAVVAFSQSLPLPKATEAQARAGTDNNTVMTPLRTKQAIEENGGSGIVTSVNGNSGAVTVTPANIGAASTSGNNAFTGTNSTAYRFRNPPAALSTGSQTLVANTDYTVAAMTSALNLTLPSGTAGDAIWIDLIGCNGTAAVTFSTPIQRIGEATGTVSTITPPAGAQWIMLKYAGGSWKFADSFYAVRFAADSSGTDAYAITVPNYAAYAAGDIFTFTAATANTGAATLSVNGLGAGTIYKASGSSITTALETGDILVGQKVTVVSDGTNWQVTSRLASSGSGGGSYTLPVGHYYRWTTTDLANVPAGTLVADGTNGTQAVTPADGLTTVVQGGGSLVGATPSPAPATFASSQNVTLAPSVGGAVVKYTTDGTTAPSRSVGSTYSSPIAIAATTTLKWMEYKNLYADSTVTTGVYTITPTDLLNDPLVYASSGAAGAAGWTNASGTPTWNYTTSPAPFNGQASSLYTGWAQFAAHTFAASSDVWAKVTFRATVLNNNSTIFRLKDTGGGDAVRLYARTGGDIKLYVGTTNVGTSFAAGTTYTVWVHYVSGTGTNAVGTVYLTTSNTSRGSPVISITNGTSTLAASAIELGSDANAVLIWQDLKISNTEITN